MRPLQRGLLGQYPDCQAQGLERAQAMIAAVLAGALHQDGWVLLGQAHQAPHPALAHPPLTGEPVAAHLQAAWPNARGSGEQLRGLAAGVEGQLLVGQDHRAGPVAARVRAQQRLRAAVADLHQVFVQPHQHLLADGRRARGVVAVVHPHGGVVAHGAHQIAERREAQRRQRRQCCALLLEHGLHLALLPAVDARGGPAQLPVLQEVVLRPQRVEAPALERGGLGVLDRALHGPLAVGVAHPGRIGHAAVVRQHGGIHGVQLGLVQVGLDDAFLEVVQHDVAGGAAEVAEGLLVQLRPGLLAGLPHHTAEAPPRVAQRHDEQPRAAPALGDRVEGQRTLTVVDLRLFAGGELQAVELLGVTLAQPGHEALDAVVAVAKTVVVHQVLVHGHGVALQPRLGFDELAPGLARRGARQRGSRWPGWGNLSPRRRGCRFSPGGQPGGIYTLSLKSALVGPDGLAVNPRDALDLALAAPLLQQRGDGGLLVRLQDVHSLPPLPGRSVNVLPTGADGAGSTPRPRSLQVGEFAVATGGGIWVAIGVTVAVLRKVIREELLQ